MSEKQLHNINDDDDDDVRISVETNDDVFSIPILSQNITEEPVQQQAFSQFSSENIPQISQNEIRRLHQQQTFSHYPYSSPEFISQMIEAGFFACNVKDRVICLDCNLICEHWRPHIEDPREVHRNLSPNCRYVQSNLMGFRLLASSSSSPPPPPPLLSPPIRLINTNLSSTVNVAQPSTTSEIMAAITNNEEIVLVKSSENPQYAEIPRRIASFVGWPNENLPSVQDLVRAGFFYTGTRNIVTCFYCNGSLQNWGSHDNPVHEHARWFPNCRYIRQVCGEELYWRIQASKQRQQSFLNNSSPWRGNNSENRSNVAALSINRLLTLPDENLLSRLVAARLDLPVTQSLLNRNFQLSIIKRCWEDQLRIKEEDFHSEEHLHVACTILQRQITVINGNQGNITVPSSAMERIRQRQRREAASRRTNAVSTDLGNGNTSESANGSNYQYSVEAAPVVTQTKDCQNDSKPSNPCVLCLQEEKRLACIPCGHLCTCVPCGHSLRSCPICGRSIEAFVRIYV